MARRPRSQPAKTTQAEAKGPAAAEGSGDTLVEDIEARLGPLVPASKRQELVNIAVIIYQERFSGPIAHPRHLAEYERILPGAAERIVAMAERGQNHNMELQKRTVEAAIADERLGMWLGSGILTLLIAGAVLAGTIFQNNVLAGLLLGAAILNVVALLFNRGKK